MSWHVTPDNSNFKQTVFGRSNRPSTDSGRRLPKPKGSETCCVICMDRTDKVILRPCGHEVYCLSCARHKKYCGVCGAPINHKVTVTRDREEKLRIPFEPSYMKEGKFKALAREEPPPTSPPEGEGDKQQAREARFLAAMRDFDWSKPAAEAVEHFLRPSPSPSLSPPWTPTPEGATDGRDAETQHAR